MSLHKKILEYHLRRLNDKDPQVRLKTIQELVELGDAAALEALQHTFQNDADDDVRKAAQAAGRAIFIKNRQQQT